MGIVLFILCTSFLAAIGIFIIVAGCALDGLKTAKGSCWVLTVFFFYFLVPLPIMFIKRVNKVLSIVKNDEELSCWAIQNKSTILKTILISNFVLFFTTGITISAFALPIILARAKVIKWGAVGLATVGNLFIFGSMLAFLRGQSKEEQKGEGPMKLYITSHKNADEAMLAMIKRPNTNTQMPGGS